MVKKMTDIIPTILQVLLIVIAITIVFHKENFTIIILISAFGLVAATLYALNQAPDVAIAEVAIGSAIIPLIYVISISRQREFIVLDRVDHDKHDLDQKNEEIYGILINFVNTYDLRLNVCSDIKGTDEELTNELNVDLIISYNESKNRFEFRGKSSSILMKRLKDITSDKDYIKVITLKEGESID
jgi:putative multicomponent Na+:H+ antiporter subunit B